MTRRAFSVSIFARHQGEVLLIRHKRLGTYLPVGGELEPGETPLEAARRELYEETGLTGALPLVQPLTGAPEGLLGYEEHPAGSKGTHLNFCFLADVDSRAVRPNDEFDAHLWTSDASSIDCPPNVRELVAMAVCAATSPHIMMARRWLAAFNGRDLEALLSLYADDAVHTSPKLREREPQTQGQVVGKPALRAWWQGAMQRLPELRYVERHLTAGGERVFMEYTRQHPGEPDLEVAEVLVVRGGRIVASHVFHG